MSKPYVKLLICIGTRLKTKVVNVGGLQIDNKRSIQTNKQSMNKKSKINALYSLHYDV
jgi:hypothetical protein